MPELSRFYGIIIYMFAKDHLPPHFHAKYNEYKALIDIYTGDILEGHLPIRATRLVQDWAELHQEELVRNWKESRKDNPSFRKIKPLE